MARALGKALRETGQALERLGRSLQGNYAFREERECGSWLPWPWQAKSHLHAVLQPACRCTCALLPAVARSMHAVLPARPPALPQ